MVLEAGLGDGISAWSSVYTQLSADHRVFAYNRAGYGRSRSSASERDGLTLVAELRQTLQRLGLDPPYLLVGHSLGGTLMELYTRRYPDEVAALVLVDSRHADFTARCLRAAAGFCTPPAILTAMMPTAAKRELAAIDTTMSQLRHSGPFPPIPLRVLSSDSALMGGARFAQVWAQTQDELATLSAQSAQRRCTGCGHYVQRERPQMVIDAVAEVAEFAFPTTKESYQGDDYP